MGTEESGNRGPSSASGLGQKEREGRTCKFLCGGGLGLRAVERPAEPQDLRRQNRVLDPQSSSLLQLAQTRVEALNRLPLQS